MSSEWEIGNIVDCGIVVDHEVRWKITVSYTNRRRRKRQGS
jgi:hypothetical protein